MIRAASRAASAIAALVALVVVKIRSVGRWWVVNRLRLSIRTADSKSFAALPPSSTTSGFSGQYLSQVNDVVLKGLRPPAGAIATYSVVSGSAIRTWSVKAPTVSAFHAWGRIVYTVGVIGIRVVEPRIGIVDVSGR